VAPSDVALRDPRSSDFPTLLRWRADPENQRLLMWRSGAESTADVESWIARRTGDPEGRFSIVSIGERPAGFVQLTRIDKTDGHAYLGLLVDAAEQGQGVGHEALRLMEARAREMGLSKLLLEVLNDNPGALRFWMSTGFRVVGTLRRHHEHGGHRYDVAVLEKVFETGEASELAPKDLPAFPNETKLVREMAADPEVQDHRARLFSLMGKYKYAYNWTWYGRPIIQLPQDVMALQTIVLSEKPDLIIETGIAHGGSLILSASLLELLGEGSVLGVDIDIRSHNRAAIEAHPLAHRISMIQGSSIDEGIAEKIRTRAKSAKRVMVCLDSNHTADHVARELDLYAPLVTVGQHLIVFDTAIEDLPASDFSDRQWRPGNSPKTAVHTFLKANPGFVIDSELEQRLLFTVAPDGYLKRLR